MKKKMILAALLLTTTPVAAEIVGPGYSGRSVSPPPGRPSSYNWHMNCGGGPTTPFIVVTNGRGNYVDVVGPHQTRRYHWESMSNLSRGFMIVATDPENGRTMTFRFGSEDGSWVLPESNSDGSRPGRVRCGNPY